MINLCLGEEGVPSLSTCRYVWIGYSGGLDSTVLLHRLANQIALKPKLRAIHVNHGLSPHAVAWEAHCHKMCETLQIPLYSQAIILKDRSNLEEAAREARYNVFKHYLNAGDVLALGHHQNDQAETFLLNLCRGAGIDGLAAMKPLKSLYEGVVVWRPFLAYARHILEAYAKKYDLSWVNDESNEEQHFARNYLRHTILPLLEARWPNVTAHIAKTTDHCQQSQIHLDELACLDCPELVVPTPNLMITRLLNLSKSRALNVLRYWLRSNNFCLPSASILNKVMTEVVQAKPSANPQLSWGAGCIKRYQNQLYLLHKAQVTHNTAAFPQTLMQPHQLKRSSNVLPSLGMEWSSFPMSLSLQDGASLEARPALEGVEILPGSLVSIRFRQGGETFYWRRQTKSLKKLFQEWKVPVWLREETPLVYINGILAVVVGYAISDYFYRQNNEHLYKLECSRTS